MFTDSALTTLNHHLEVIDRLAAPFQNRALLVLNCANAALAKIAADGAGNVSSLEQSAVHDYATLRCLAQRWIIILQSIWLNRSQYDEASEEPVGTWSSCMKYQIYEKLIAWAIDI